MVRQHQTSDAQLRIENLEIPGSMLRFAPE
jgi:hypothetical protein